MSETSHRTPESSLSNEKIAEIMQRHLDSIKKQDEQLRAGLACADELMTQGGEAAVKIAVEGFEGTPSIPYGFYLGLTARSRAGR